MTKKRKPGALYFTGVTRAGQESVALIGNYYALEDKTEQRIALVTLRKGVWGAMDLSGIGHDIKFVGSSTAKYFVLERNRGLYRINPPSGVQFERIKPKRQGFLMDLSRVGAHWYAVGGHHQAYRENGDEWDPIDESIYIGGEKGETKLLLSIDGSSETDIYTVGFNGVIFHYDGKSWKQLPSPTNAGLQRVLCVNKDEIYLCGNANGLYRGSGSKWLALTEPDEDVTFWDMAVFQGKVYVCTKKQLFIVKDGGLEEVRIPVKGPLGFYRMDADADELWTCGNECVLSFDGKKWKQYIFPDNE